MITKFTSLFRSFFQSEKVAGLLLVICTIISLSIANCSSGTEYVHLMHTKIDLSFSNVNLNYTLEEWVNDALMAIFFLMVGLEVERELYIGELASFKKAVLPVAAAAGGMVFPAFIHFLFNHGTTSRSGFAIPMATDIAFALGMLALAGNKVPTAVKVFLTALAIIDDIGAIIVIAFFYTKTVFFTYLLAAIAIFGMLLLLNKAGINKLFFYLIPGVVMWYCLLQSGVHATIAGVLLAFAIPFNSKDTKSLSYRLQQILHRPVAFIIVPIFALVNTAIILPDKLVENLATRNSLGIITGLILGKLTGIFFVPYILVKSSFASMAEGIKWKHLAGIGLLGGIGFTMSMFISNLAFDNNQVITTSKLSILVASSLSGVAGVCVFIFMKENNNND